MEFTEEQKLFIVRELACFRTPTQVAERVKEEFSLEERPDRGHIRQYNPLQCADVAEKWRVIFEATRTAFLDETAKADIAHRAWRIQEAQDAHARALKAKNEVLAQEIREYVAKEMGGLFTNTRNLAGKLSLNMVDDLLAATDEPEEP